MLSILCTLGTLVFTVGWPSAPNVAFGHNDRPVAADTTEKGSVSPPHSVAMPQGLLDQLHASDYRVRREAFLKLCDLRYPIDEWLHKEVAGQDPQNVALAKWLIQLRMADGKLSERLEILSAFQRASQGDDSVIYQLAYNDRWEQALDVLSLLAPEMQQSILKDQGGLAQFVELAWRSDNQWAVPRLHNLIVAENERVSINRWWKDLGLPSEWKLDEPETSVVSLSKLEADSEWTQAIAYARSNAMEDQVERLLIRSGDWERWLESSKDLVSGVEFGGRDVQAQRLVANLLLGKIDDAKLVWQGMKENARGNASPGLLTLALVMDDMSFFESSLKSLDSDVAFETYLFQFGSIKRAFEAKGVTDFSDKEVWSGWLTNEVLRLMETRGATGRRGERDPLVSLLSAVHQSGDPAAEKAVDDACAIEIARDGQSIGAYRVQELLLIYSRLNQRPKALELLKRIAIEKGYPRSVFSNRNISEHRDASEESSFEIVFSENIAEPFIAFEVLVRDYFQSQGLSASDAVERAFDEMESLYHGRLPDGWEEKDRLRSFVMDVRKRISDLGRDEASFCISMSSVYEAIGDLNDAMALLQDYVFQSDATRKLAQLLGESGRPDLAGQILLKRPLMAVNDSQWFLETASMLEQAGNFRELDLLRVQHFSAVHTTPYFSNNILSPYHSVIPESLLVESPESEVLVEKWRRLSQGRLTYLEGVVRYLQAKKDITRIDAAYDAMVLDFFQRSGDLSRLSGFGTRSLFMNAIPVFVLKAIHEGDFERADLWMRMAIRLEPTQIQLPIDIIPIADKSIPKEMVDGWFDAYFQVMAQSIDEFPEDAVTLNNTAWLCALCNRKLDKAKEFAERAVAKRDDPTYLDTLAEVEFRSGNVQRAVEISQSCYEREPREDQHKDQLKRFAKALTKKNE